MLDTLLLYGGIFVAIWSLSAYIEDDRPPWCAFGLHRWGEYRVVNRTTLVGERTVDGWDHETFGPEQVVVQCCRDCDKRRDRDEMDPDEVDDDGH